MLTLSKTVHNPTDQFRRGWSAGEHRGVDYGWDKGYLKESLRNLSAAPGKVVSTYKGNDFNGGWGRRCIVEVTDRVRIAYAHFNTLAVSTGDTVWDGTFLGEMGETGLAFGVHQHFEVYVDGVRVDPAPYLAGKTLPGTPVIGGAAPAGSSTQKRTVRGSFVELNGRNHPSSKSGTVKQRLRKNITGSFDAYMRGQKVTIGSGKDKVTSDVWFRGAFNGNWFAAAGFTSQSTAGLKNLGTYKEPAKPVKQTIFKTPANGQFYYRNYSDALAGVNYVSTALPGGREYVVSNNPKTGPVQITVPGVGLRWVGTRRSPAKVTAK